MFIVKYVFKNENTRSTLLISNRHYICLRGVESFIAHLPWLEHLIEKRFYSLFSETGTSLGPGTNRGFVIEMKLCSTSSALLNFPDETTWFTSKDNENLEVCPFSKTHLWNQLGIRVKNWSCYRVVPGHRNHLNDPASEFLSTHWWRQNPACQRCFYKPLKSCHPASEFLHSS